VPRDAPCDASSQFVEKFARVYETEEEKEERFWVFLANMESNTKKNAALAAENKDQVHGITKFSDMTKEVRTRALRTFC